MNDSYLSAAVEIAREAGKILVEELSQPLDIRYKGDEVDLVTQADKRSEQAIVTRLLKYFPDHAIAAEEGTGKESDSEFRWHVDPLDGTTNFAHGYPCFCVSIALAQSDTLLAAVVFNYDGAAHQRTWHHALRSGLQPVHRKYLLLVGPRQIAKGETKVGAAHGLQHAGRDQPAQ